LRLGRDLTGNLLATTATTHGAVSLHPITDFTIHRAWDDETVNKLLGFWAFSTTMCSLHKYWPSHLLLSCITRGGAITLVAPLTNLTVNWAWSHNAALLFNKGTFAIKATPLWKYLTTTTAFLDSEATECITSSPLCPFVELAINRTRHNLARLRFFSILCAFHTSMLWLNNDSTCVELDARSTSR
jgi:hypothetical protein